MANTFVPYDIKIDDITSSSVLVTWDIHNVAEYTLGTYYKVYVKESETSPAELPVVANVNSYSVPLRSDNFWVGISSVVRGEESPISPYVEIEARIGVTDSTDYSTIAVDVDGRPSKLLVDSQGRVIVSASGEEATLGDVATETTLATILDNVSGFRVENAAGLALISAKSTSIINAINAHRGEDILRGDALTITVNTARDDIIAAIGMVSADVQNLNSANQVAFSDVITNLDDIAEAVSNIEATLASGVSVLIRADAELTGVTTAGTVVTLPWSRVSIIKQITVILEAGSATDFILEIWNRTLSTSERNVVVRESLSGSYSPNRLDFIHSIPYINVQGNNELIVRVIPNNGTSNSFYIVINGEKAKQ